MAARSRGRPRGGVGPSTMSMLLPARVMTSLKKITALTLRSLRMRGLTTWLRFAGHHHVATAVVIHAGSNLAHNCPAGLSAIDPLA